VSAIGYVGRHRKMVSVVECFCPFCEQKKRKYTPRHAVTLRGAK